MALRDGVTITYQGRGCLPIFEYSRSTGPEPDFGYVFVPRSEFGDFTIKEAVEGVDALPGAVEGSTVDRNAGGGRTLERSRPTTRTRPAPPRAGFTSLGELVLTEAVAGVEHTVRWQDVLVHERAVEAANVSDDESQVCKVELTDIRYLWQTGGLLVAWINVPFEGAGQQEGGTTDAVAAANAATMIPGSLRDGTPWTLRQVLEERVLPALPGRPELKRISSDVADRFPRGHVWNGVLPKTALADLLDEFKLVLALNLDGSVSLWKKGEGAIQEEGGSEIRSDTSAKDVDPRVASSRPLVSYKHRHAVFVVLGPPVVATARMQLEAVGDVLGRIVPLEQALASYGMTLDQAREWVVQPHERRGVLSLSTEALREIERWAFRWFQIPGGAAKNADKLPLLPGRGVVDSVGEYLPPRAWSETFAVADATQIAEAVSRVATRAAALVPTGKKAGETRRAEHALDEAIARAKALGHYTACANVAFSEQSNGFRLDHERGVLMFEAIQGHLVQDGCSLDEAVLNGVPRVELEFGYELKPTIEEDLSITHRYHSVWVLGPDGSISRATEIPVGAQPTVVHRPDLVEVRGLAGESNRAILDAVSRALANDFFEAQQSTQGEVVHLCRPTPVVNTGRVLSITWACDEEKPRVTVHVGTFSPLSPAPKPDLRTRAFGPQARAVPGAIAPRGVRRG